MFDNCNVNRRKNEGFLTYIPCIPIPEYGQSNAPLIHSADACFLVMTCVGYARARAAKKPFDSP